MTLRIVSLTLVLLVVPPAVRAAHEIELKTGKTITGEIVSENESFYVIDRGGTKLKVLKNLIVSIDGKALTGAATQAQQPAEKRSAKPRTSPQQKPTVKPDGKTKRTIVLKNGTTLNAAIVSENANFYGLDMDGTRLNILKSLVARIDQEGEGKGEDAAPKPVAAEEKPPAPAPKTAEHSPPAPGRPAQAPKEAASTPAITIALKNGNVLKGRVLSQNPNFVTIDVDGATLRVLKSMIERMGEAPVAAAKPSGKKPEAAAAQPAAEAALSSAPDDKGRDKAASAGPSPGEPSPKSTAVAKAEPRDKDKQTEDEPARRGRRSRRRKAARQSAPPPAKTPAPATPPLATPPGPDKPKSGTEGGSGTKKVVAQAAETHKADKQPASKPPAAAQGEPTGKKTHVAAKSAPSEKVEEGKPAKKPAEKKAAERAEQKDDAEQEPTEVATKQETDKEESSEVVDKPTPAEEKSDRKSRREKRRARRKRRKAASVSGAVAKTAAAGAGAAAGAAVAAAPKPAAAPAKAPSVGKKPSGDKKESSEDKSERGGTPKAAAAKTAAGESKAEPPPKPASAGAAEAGEGSGEKPVQVAVATPTPAEKTKPAAPEVEPEAREDEAGERPKKKPGFVYPDAGKPSGGTAVPAAGSATKKSSSGQRDARVSELVLRSTVDEEQLLEAVPSPAEEEAEEEIPEIPPTRREELAEQLESAKPAERVVAAAELGRSRAPWAAELLADALSDETSLPAAEGEEAALDAPKSVGAAVARTLGMMGPAALEPVEKALGHRNPAVRRNAAKAMVLIPGERATKALVEALKDDDLEVQVTATMELTERKPVPLLIEGVNSRNANLRRNAIEILGELQEKSAADHIIVALTDRNSSVREKAAWAIGRIGDPRAGEPLLTCMKDGISFVRRNAAIALGRIREPKAVDVLIKALKDESPFVRKSAAAALGAFRDTRAIEPLVQASKDPDPEVAATAKKSLHLHTDIGALIRGLDDKSPVVRKNTEYALFLMTGQDHGSDHEKWKQWWATKSGGDDQTRE